MISTPLEQGVELEIEGNIGDSHRSYKKCFSVFPLL